MNPIQSITEVKIEHFAAYSILFLSVIAPGLLVLYLFKFHFFLELDSFKLLLLSIAFSLPIPTINTVFSGLVAKEAPDLEEHVFSNVAISFVGMYLAILISYIFSLNFKEFLICISSLECLFIIIIFATERQSKSSP